MTEPNFLEQIRSSIRGRSQPPCVEGVDPIHRISTVGGQYREGNFVANGNPYVGDAYTFFLIMKYIVASGLPVSPDFTIENYNLDPEYGGRDFLHPENAAPADLILFLMVFDPEEEDVPRFSSRYPNNERCVSLLHSHEAFREAIARTGAGMLGFRSVIGDSIDERLYVEQTKGVPGEWRVLFPAREVLRLSDPFNRNSGIPCGVMVNCSYIDKLRAGGMAPRADGAYRTLLHQRIAECRPD